MCGIGFDTLYLFLISSSYNAVIGPLHLIIEDNIFDISKKKSKDYYTKLVGIKAQFPNSINKLPNDFNLSLEQLTQIFQLPHIVAFEPYVRAFHCEVLWHPLYQLQVVSNRLRFKRSLFSLCPGVRVGCIIFSMFVLFQRIFGLNLNLFGTNLQRKKCNYHCKTL